MGCETDRALPDGCGPGTVDIASEMTGSRDIVKGEMMAVDDGCMMVNQ